MTLGAEGATAECRFCAIVRGEAPAAWVLDGEKVVAFLDARPLFRGHVLVVPRVHVVTLPELPGELAAPLLDAVQRVARALERGLAADGSLVALNNRVSQSVPHLHFHVIPRRRGDGLRHFFWPREKYGDEEEREDYRRRIAQAISDDVRT